MSLTRAYPLAISPSHVARFEKFYHDELGTLAAIDLSIPLGKKTDNDYVLHKNRITASVYPDDD